MATSLPVRITPDADTGSAGSPDRSWRPLPRWAAASADRHAETRRVEAARGPARWRSLRRPSILPTYEASRARDLPASLGPAEPFFPQFPLSIAFFVPPFSSKSGVYFRWTTTPHYPAGAPASHLTQARRTYRPYSTPRSSSCDAQYRINSRCTIKPP